MSHARYSKEKAAQIGESLYQRNIRAQVEDKYDGQILVLDIETGDYEIGDTTLEGAHKLLAKHPDAALYSLRIGYEGVYSFGGATIRRAK